MDTFKCVLSIAAFASYAALMIYMAVNFGKLPDSIPMHYDLNGNPDAWTGRWFLIFYLLCPLFFYFLLHFFERNKWIYNTKYNYNLRNEEVSDKQVQNMKFLFYVLKNVFLIYFSWFTINDLYKMMTHHNIFGIWEMVIFFAVIFVILIFFTIRNFQIEDGRNSM